MSQPPPYPNPDTRQLPDGWVSQWDANYNAWFYINTLAQPPVPTWDHPLGPAPGAYSSPQGAFPEPQHASPYPEAASPFPSQQSASPYPPQQGGGAYSPGYPQPSPSPGYNQSVPPQYPAGPPPQDGKGLLSGLFGGQTQPQPQQQPVYAMSSPPPPPPQKHGIGMSTVAIGLG
ncbi:WW domain-containing protein [Mycena sanguinolenta]|uniref:WW domain-containing protein n=1 Tax=Mycena sanguinolenta TaxID=230812 RepID=A0A8H6YB41_9AGAR|nr:WW domain-containing protein [Mycena sanguinolenta]